MNEEVEITEESKEPKENPIKILNGVEYFEIPLKASTGETMTLRLFNSQQPERLEFEEHNEYKVRRSWNYKNTKSHLKGKFAWLSKNITDIKKKNYDTSWGTLTKEKAAYLLNHLKNNKEE